MSVLGLISYLSCSIISVSGGISAYNAGVKNVRTYERMDVGTTGGDYSNDVVARAQWFKSKGYWKKAVIILLFFILTIVHISVFCFVFVWMK